jgi:hypothetical protein
LGNTGDTAKSKVSLPKLQNKNLSRAIYGLIQKLLKTAIREDLRVHRVNPDLPLMPASRLVQNKVIIFFFMGLQGFGTRLPFVVTIFGDGVLLICITCFISLCKAANL